MTSSLKTICCFGEMLWDVYPEGKKLGGAPFNVAAHLNKLGSNSQVISRVGSDALGDELINAVKQQGLDSKYIQIDAKYHTGRVNVSLDQQGLPTYDIESPSAWDQISLTQNNIDLVKSDSALVFGTLALRNQLSRDSLLHLLKLSALNICDLNIRQSFYSKDLIEALLLKTHILKINDDEAELLKHMFALSEDDFFEKLSKRFSLQIIIKTLGKDGALVWEKGLTCRGKAIDIVPKDTVGSGDAFLAAFMHNYLLEKSLQVCIDAACQLGAFVATRSGAVPEHDF